MASQQPPKSILIIGSGVFGLSTLHALLQRPLYNQTHLTLLEAHAFPAPHTASIDNTRIIRADYADPHYSALAATAQTSWRDSTLWSGAYRESGMLMTADSGREGGREYMQKAMANVSTIEGGGDVMPVGGRQGSDNMSRATSSGAAPDGEVGYLNRRSGWADAEVGMKSLRTRVESLAASRGNVAFVIGEADALIYDGSEVRGALLPNSVQVRAELTILATGAWSGKFVDLRGVASARGQCMAYVDVTPPEQEVLQHNPVQFNISNGMFTFPPCNGVLKVARHAYGYTNRVRIPAPLFAREYSEEKKKKKKKKEVEISLPTFPDHLPLHDAGVLSDYLHSTIPLLDTPIKSQRRKFTKTRICWYLDSHTGEYLVCRHPKAPKSLFLATAGSGHGYKFLPVLGERIVDVLDGTDMRNGGCWTEKWRWPVERAETFQREDGDGEVWCEDGSRAGEKGCELTTALREGRAML